MSRIKDLNHLSQSELAALWECSTRTIQRLPELPTLRHGQGQDSYYVWSECRAFEMGRLSQREDGESLTDRQRRERAEADMAEMEARQMAGDLLERKPAILAWSAFLGRLKDNLLGYSGRVAPRIEDGMILAEREAVLNKEMHQVLRDVVAEVEKAAAEVDG